MFWCVCACRSVFVFEFFLFFIIFFFLFVIISEKKNPPSGIVTDFTDF